MGVFITWGDCLKGYHNWVPRHTLPRAFFAPLRLCVGMGDPVFMALHSARNRVSSFRSADHPWNGERNPVSRSEDWASRA